MALSNEGRVYSEAELDHIVAKRLAERQEKEAEEKWIATVNATIDAINRHVSADGAHPRLLDLVGRAVQAAERVERLVVAASPEDIQKFLPAVIEREKREAEEREERKREFRQLRNMILAAVPIITGVLGFIQVIIQWHR